MASIQMKHLICFLLAFVTFDGLNAQVQQSTRPQGDSNFSVWLTSDDTTKVKVFNRSSDTTYGSGVYRDSLLRFHAQNYMWSREPLYYMFETGRVVRIPDYLIHTFNDATLPLKGYGGTYLSESIPFPDSLNKETAKYDTIGPTWKLVSDTAAGHWNPVSAMQVYEVREYVNDWVKSNPGSRIYAQTLIEEIGLVPRHHLWLDSNKKPLTLKVWEDFR